MPLLLAVNQKQSKRCGIIIYSIKKNMLLMFILHYKGKNIIMLFLLACKMEVKLFDIGPIIPYML